MCGWSLVYPFCYSQQYRFMQSTGLPCLKHGNARSIVLLICQGFHSSLRQQHCNCIFLIIVGSSIYSALRAPHAPTPTPSCQCDHKTLPDFFCEQLHVTQLSDHWARAWTSLRYSSLWSFVQELEGVSPKRKFNLLQFLSSYGHLAHIY